MSSNGRRHRKSWASPSEPCSCYTALAQSWALGAGQKKVGEGQTQKGKALCMGHGGQMVVKWEVHVVKEAFHSKELAEALVYQRREQAALMALLHGKAEKETEAWSRLHQMSLTSPWTRESSAEDIEKSWTQWIKDKQVGTVWGGRRTPASGHCSYLVTPPGKQNCGSSIQAQGACSKPQTPDLQSAV